MQGHRCGQKNKWEGGNAGATRKQKAGKGYHVSWLTGKFHVFEFNQSAVTTSLAFSHATLNDSLLIL